LAQVRHIPPLQFNKDIVLFLPVIFHLVHPGGCLSRQMGPKNVNVKNHQGLEKEQSIWEL
jgi:hypothetical protein